MKQSTFRVNNAVQVPRPELRFQSNVGSTENKNFFTFDVFTETATPSLIVG